MSKYFQKLIIIVLTLSLFLSSTVSAYSVPSTSSLYKPVLELDQKGYFENIGWKEPRLAAKVTYEDVTELLYVYLQSKNTPTPPKSNFANRDMWNERVQFVIDYLADKRLIPLTKTFGANSAPRIADTIPIIYDIFRLTGGIRPNNWPYEDVSINHLDATKYSFAIETGAYIPAHSNEFGINNGLKRTQLLRLFYVFGSEAGVFTKYDFRPSIKSTTSVSPKIEITMIPKNTDESFEILKTVWNLISQKFYFRDQIDFKDASYKMIKELMKSTNDDYTTFYTPTENQIVIQNLEGEFSGIGAKVEEKDGNVVIVAPLRGSPAEEAGLLPGDIIVKVDNLEAKGKTLNDIVNAIRGASGTTVTIVVNRNGGEKTFNIIRGVISLATIEWEYLRDGIYYMHINQFTQDVDKLFSSTIEEMQKHAIQPNYGSGKKNNDGAMLGLVIDLRNNPGGYLDATINLLSEMFAKDTTVVKIKSGETIISQNTKKLNPLIKDLPIALLINKGSASASEIVAGTVQDYGRGRLFGETTFGKGTVQELLSFVDGSSVKLTIAKWLTPKGREIDKVGITPDQVYDPVNYRDLMSSRDTPLNAALAWLNGLRRRY